MSWIINVTNYKKIISVQILGGYHLSLSKSVKYQKALKQNKRVGYEFSKTSAGVLSDFLSVDGEMGCSYKCEVWRYRANVPTQLHPCSKINEPSALAPYDIWHNHKAFLSL